VFAQERDDSWDRLFNGSELLGISGGTVKWLEKPCLGGGFDEVHHGLSV
jgi:hypothetical protein